MEFMQINIADREHAKYVENHVPSYIWKVKLFIWLQWLHEEVLLIGHLSLQFNEADYDFCRHLLLKTMTIEIIFNVTLNVLTLLSSMQESQVFATHPLLLVRYVTSEHIKRTVVFVMHHLNWSKVEV